MHFRKMKVVFLFIHVLAVVMISVMTVHLCSMSVGKVPEECDIPVRFAALVVLLSRRSTYDNNMKIAA